MLKALNNFVKTGSFTPKNNMSSFDDFITAPYKSLEFPENQYVKQETDKKQVVLHHTGGSGNPFNGWEHTPERVATCIAIARDGTIIQGFSSRYWGYHIGIGVPGNDTKKVKIQYQRKGGAYDKQSIGIEIINWGSLYEKDGKYFGWPAKKKGVWTPDYQKYEVPADEVVHYPEGFRGLKHFQKYTREQIESVRQLLIYWNHIYGIPLDYIDDIFEINTRALNFEPGIYTHCCYRSDKSDIHPQKEMIDMLKSLKK